MPRSIIFVKEKKNSRKFHTKKEWGRLEWFTTCGILLIRFFFYLLGNKPQIGEDTHTYVELTWRGFLKGERMPLYSLLIWTNRLFFQDSYLLGVVGCQIILSLISILFLYRAVRMATKNRGIACIIALFYGGNPWIMNADLTILTESLAISISVFLLYHTVCYLQSPSLRRGMAMVVCVLSAAILKPALSVYVAAYLIFMGIQFFCEKDRRKITIKVSVALFGIALLLLCYAGQVWKNAGTFSLDKRGVRHMLITCLETELYKNYPDQELVEEIDRIYLENNKSVDVKTTINPIKRLFGENNREQNIRVREFCRYCIRTEPGVYVRYLIRHFVRATDLGYMLEQSELYENPLLFRILYYVLAIVFPIVKIGHLYLIGGATFLLLVIKWKKEKACPWYYLGTAGMILVILVSVIVGIDGGYVRCLSYVLPFAYSGLALLFQDLLKGLEKCRESDGNSK